MDAGSFMSLKTKLLTLTALPGTHPHKPVGCTHFQYPRVRLRGLAGVHQPDHFLSTKTTVGAHLIVRDVADREHVGLVDSQLVQRQRACAPMPLAQTDGQPRSPVCF